MNIKGQDNVQWIEIDSEHDDEIGVQDSQLEQEKLKRIDRWYTKLGVDRNVIGKELPIIISDFNRHFGTQDGVKVQFKIHPPILKRTVRIRESRPAIFQTNSDAERFIYMLGLDIAEHIFMNHPESLEGNETWQTYMVDSKFLEIFSTVDYKTFIMRNISRSFAAGNISKEQFLIDLKAVFDSGNSEVKERIRESYLALIDEHGFAKEREKELTRLRGKKFRGKKSDDRAMEDTLH